MPLEKVGGIDFPREAYNKGYNLALKNVFYKYPGKQEYTLQNINLNVGHGGTYRDTGGGWFGEVAVAWLDWRLKGSQAAAGYFVGADCRLCTNPLWKVAKKGMQ